MMYIVYLLLLKFITSYASSLIMDDDILYGINWYEKPIENNSSKPLTFKTSNRETYSCFLPITHEPKQSGYSHEKYDGPTELELLKRLYDDKVCSVKESPYWFYEVCHDKHVRQYHEALETTGKPATVQQYFLGYYQAQEVMKTDNSENVGKKKIPQMMINSVKLPYFTVNMTGGDFCDLINRPRSVEVFYFCHENVQANLYDFQEIRSCEYQAIIFTKYLCDHPAYKMKENYINSMSCFPLGDSPVIPQSLAKINAEIKASENIISSVDSIIDTSKHEPQIKVEAYRKNGVIYYRIIAVDKSETSENPETESKESELIKKVVSESQQESSSEASGGHSIKVPFAESNNLMEKYLSAKYCIESGASYWRNRVCFLKKISQYHVEVDLETQEIIMGFWNEEKHLKWLKEFPVMKPKFPVDERMDIYHHYSDGSYCEQIKANRRVILKISCVNDNSSSVSVTVSEPTICNYVVMVKGSIFCPLVKGADEFGLMNQTED